MRVFCECEPACSRSKSSRNYRENKVFSRVFCLRAIRKKIILMLEYLF